MYIFWTDNYPVSVIFIDPPKKFILHENECLLTGRISGLMTNAALRGILST